LNRLSDAHTDLLPQSMPHLFGRNNSNQTAGTFSGKVCPEAKFLKTKISWRVIFGSICPWNGRSDGGSVQGTRPESEEPTLSDFVTLRQV